MSLKDNCGGGRREVKERRSGVETVLNGTIVEVRERGGEVIRHVPNSILLEYPSRGVGVFTVVQLK